MQEPEGPGLRLFVSRHGQTHWNVERRWQGHHDSGLTERGLAQARALGRRLALEPIDGALCSDLGRARQTVGEALAGRALEVRFSTSLRERLLGQFEGLTLAEIERQHPLDFERWRSGDPDARMKGGETRREVAERVSTFLEGLRQEQLTGNWLVISHGGWLDQLFRVVVGLEPSGPRRWSVDNCSLQQVRLERGVWKLVTWGEVAHLSAPDLPD